MIFINTALLAAALFAALLCGQIFSKLCSNTLSGGDKSGYTVFLTVNGIIACAFFFVSSGFRLTLTPLTVLYSVVYAVIVFLCLVFAMKAYSVATLSCVYVVKSACVRISREEFHDGILFENNIFLTDGTPVYGEYTSIYTLSSSRNIIRDINGSIPVMIKKPDGKTYTFEDWTRGCGKDTGSITEDPLFADARSYDFTLSENSPALKFGFKALSGFLATGRKN